VRVGCPNIYIYLWTKGLLLAAILTSGIGYSEQFNLRNLIPGTRANGMGGAYTALSDDASGGWYNPAGVGFTKGVDVSLSANAFTKSLRRVKGAVGGSDVAQSSTSLYPAFAGGTAGLSAWRFSYAFFTSDHDSVDESFRYAIPASGGVSSYTYFRRQLVFGNKLHVGASTALKIGSNVSVGIGQFYYRRTRQSSLIESSVYETGATFDSTIRQSTLNEGVLTTAGFAIRGQKAAAGVSARIPKRLADNTLVESSQTTFSGSSQQKLETSTKPHAYDEITPVEYSVGLAWTPASSFTLSGDCMMIDKETAVHEDLDGVSTVRTFNYAAGMEIKFGSLLLRSGYFTNNSTIKELDETKLGQPPRVNYSGASLNVGWEGKSSGTTFGVSKQIGVGREQSVNGSSSLYDIEAESTTYLVTSRYAMP